MTLEKAIKEYKEALALATSLPVVMSKQSIQLGIEALEREWVRRRGIANVKEGLLPSETKEGK